MGRRYNRKFAIFVLFLLIISFISHTTSLSSLGLRESVENSFELGPPYANVADPLAYPSIRDERRLGPIIIEQIKTTPEILSLDMAPTMTTNMFLQLANKEPDKVLFSMKENLEIDPSLRTTINNIFIILCYSGDKLYFARVVIYKDRSREPNIEVYPEQEFKRDYQKIGISEEIFGRLSHKIEGIVPGDDRTLYFIPSSDESVKAVSKFLEKINAPIMNIGFQGIVNARRLILSKAPIPEIGIIAVSEAKDIKKRAYSIVGTMFADRGIDYNRFEQAFNVFWKLWQENKEEEFDLDKVTPELILLVSQMERDSRIGSNEGNILLQENAYEKMLETLGFELDDCQEVIEDIRRIFKKVARHLAIKHNKAAAEEKKAAAGRIVAACRKAIIDSAKKGHRYKRGPGSERVLVPSPNEEDLRIPLAEIKNISPEVRNTLQRAGFTTAFAILKAGTEGRLTELDDIGQRIKPISIQDMPGQREEKLVFYDISVFKGPLPSDLVYENGIIWINPMFVKLMYKLGYEWDLKGPKGNIYDHRAYGTAESPAKMFPEKSPYNTLLGNIYESILYSLAWHTLGGHFPINKYGFAQFGADELWAQGERGGKDYLYVNIFSMLFYWIEMLERHAYPKRRCTAFLAKYPELLRKFGEVSEEYKLEIKKRLPDHLIMWASDRSDREVIPMPYTTVETEQTRDEVLAILREAYPGTVSNEGVDSGEGATSGLLVFGLFNLLNYAEGALSLQAIKDTLGDSYESDDVDRVLSLLVDDLRIVDRKDGYETIPMTGEQQETVQEILKDVKGVPQKDDLKGLKGRVFGVTESRWADGVLECVKDLKARGQKTVFALEMGWIPPEHRSEIQPLIQEIRRIDSNGVVNIVMQGDRDIKDETPEQFAKRIVEMSTEGGGDILPQNIVVLASKSTIETKEISLIKAKSDVDENKAFLVGINGTELTGDSYIRLMEMMTMALRMSLGQGPISSHPNIIVNPLNKRTIIFIPKAEPLDAEHIRNIYKAQIKVLLAA